MTDLSDSLTQEQFDAVEETEGLLHSLATEAARSGNYNTAERRLYLAQQIASIIGGRKPE